MAKINTLGEFYCGNNALDLDLLSSKKVIGNRYQCFKKGVGKGLKEPLLRYNPNYKPIEPVSKIFCGAKKPKMVRFGTRAECLRKGFGVGQRLQFSKNNPKENPPPPKKRDKKPSQTRDVLAFTALAFTALFGAVLAIVSESPQKN